MCVVVHPVTNPVLDHGSCSGRYSNRVRDYVWTVVKDFAGYAESLPLEVRSRPGLPDEVVALQHGAVADAHDNGRGLEDDRIDSFGKLWQVIRQVLARVHFASRGRELDRLRHFAHAACAPARFDCVIVDQVVATAGVHQYSVG